MIEQLFNFLYSFGLSPKTLIFFLAALPVTELRASIPIGIMLLNQSVRTAFFYSVLGNLLPVVPIYFLLDPVSKRLSKTKCMRIFFEWLFKKAKKKSYLIERYEALGLMIFIGIPFPGTGVWTGCFIASILRMRFVPTFLASLGGAIIAAIIVTALVLLGKIVF